MKLSTYALLVVTIISLIIATICAVRVGTVSNELNAKYQQDKAELEKAYTTSNPEQADNGFSLSPTLAWVDQGDGILAAETARGGLCLRLDRNGSDGVFCSGEAVEEDTSGNASDGAVIFNWLANAKGLSVQREESRADKYRAIQRDLTDGIQSVERMQQAALDAAR